MMILILFMYVFAFNFGNFMTSLVNSTNMVGLALLAKYVFDKNYRKIMNDIAKTKRVIYTLASTVAIIVFNVLLITIHKTGDYTIVPTLINLLGKIVIGVLIYGLYLRQREVDLSKNVDTSINIISDLTLAFTLQSALQFVSLLVPQVGSILNFFRNANVVERAQEIYGGVRGLSVSSSGFFGIAIAYAFIVMLMIIYRRDLVDNCPIMFKSNAAYYLIFWFNLCFAILAGRVALAGLVFGLTYIVFERIFLWRRYPELKLRKLNKTSSHEWLILASFSIFFIAFLFLGFVLIKNHKRPIGLPYYLEVIHRIFRYVFSPIFNRIHFSKTVVVDGKQVLDDSNIFTSVDTLSKMYFPLSKWDYIVGVGRYTAENGGYYRNTDSGFMRNLLLSGVGNVILMFTSQLFFFNWKKKELLFQNLAILAFLSILHVKGEVLGFAQLIQSMMILLLLNSLRVAVKENSEKQTRKEMEVKL